MVFAINHRGARGRRGAAGGYRKLAGRFHQFPAALPAKASELCALQVIHEYVALLKLGHMLVFETPDGGNSPSAGDVDCSLTTEVRYRLPDGTVKTATVSLMFPASSGSVSRIMDSWYAARGELLAILYLHGYVGGCSTHLRHCIRFISPHGYRSGCKTRRKAGETLSTYISLVYSILQSKERGEGREVK